MLGAVGATLSATSILWMRRYRFPTDRTPEGCYLRIAIAFGQSKLRDCFPYLETEAQHALYTILEFRKKALSRIRTAFEEPEKSRWDAAYRSEGDAAEPADVWVTIATARGWDTRIRRDLSGIAKVETVGDRATVETVHGTRYPFRRAENGIWGLTLFTGDLVVHKERAARDYAVIERAAQDYERGKH
jgi:hypothetical protein